MKSWDTDNLSRWVSSSFGRAGARNYRIPYHNYIGYKDTVPARPCVGTGNNRFASRNLYTGQCPSGYTLATHVCQYHQTNFRETHIWVTPSSGNCRTRDIYERRTQYENNPYREYSAVVLVASNVQGRKLAIGSQNRGACLHSTSTGLASFAASCAQTIPVHPGCQSAVADAFFQTGGDVGAVNDFPVADYGSESEAGTVAATGSRSSGCVEFAEQQDRLQTSVTATGHYLALENDELVLKANRGTDILDTRITSVRSAGVYGRWDQKGPGYEFAQQSTSSTATGGVYAVVPADGYRDRVDTRTSLVVGQGLSSGLVHPWSTATGLGAMNRNLACTGGQVAKCVKRTPGVLGWGGSLDTLGSAALFRISDNHQVGVWLRQVHLTVSQDSGGSWCQQDWHPRGQDAAFAIERSTGRTLSSINSEALLKAADAHWCRSDVRYTLEFTAQQHNTCGTNGRSACAAPPGVALPAVGDEFPSYGRKNCYKTMTGYDETNAECSYVFPLPQCDPDPDNNSRADWREFTPAEVDNIGIAGEPLLVKEGAYCGTNINPPDLAGFDADPCVVVDVAVFENRPAGSDVRARLELPDALFCL